MKNILLIMLLIAGFTTLKSEENKEKNSTIGKNAETSKKKNHKKKKKNKSQDSEKKEVKTYIIEDYHFEWKIAKVNDTLISIAKTQDAISFQLVKSGSSSYALAIFEKAEDVKKLAEILKKTEAIYKKQKTTFDAQSTKQEIKSIPEEVDKCSVTFITSKDGSFSISIGRTKKYMSDPVVLKKEDVKEIAKYLEDADGIFDFVNKKINFDINPKLKQK